MRTAQLVTGRQVAVVLEPGEELLSGLADAAVLHGVRQGYVATLLGAFSLVEFIATCRRVDDHDQPVRDAVEVEFCEGVASATIAWDSVENRPHVHLHGAVGVKQYAAAGYAGHVVRAVTQYMCEAVVVEVTSPTWNLAHLANAYNLLGIEFS